MMKRTFTLLSLAVMLLASASLLAQIPNTSPIPIDFEITSPSSIARSYDYTSMADFGVNLQETVAAEVAWAHDDGMYDGDGDGMPDEGYGDSLACSWNTVMDLTGKIALIRRGACFFSQKIYNAQQAGAVGAIIVNHYANADDTGETLVNMSGADSMDAVVIPAVFVSRSTGETIMSELDHGNPVMASFTASFAYNPVGPTSYAVPETQVTAMEFLQFEVFNPSATDAALGVTGTAEITAPDGSVETLTATVDTIAALTGAVFEFDAYTPSAGVGEYSISYSNSLNSDVIGRTFTVTPHTFQQDNGNIVMNTNGTIEPNDDDFINLYNVTYDVGTFYSTGADGGVATHVSFMISNPDELFTGDAEADQFIISIYDTDVNDDGTIDIAAGDTNYDNLTIAGFGIYTISEEDQPFDMLTAELDDPLTLKPDHQYLVMVQYFGANAGIGIPPKYAVAGTDTYVQFFAEGPSLGSDLIFLDQLYTGGWGGENNFVVRLHLDGFDPNVSIEEVGALEASKISLAPNPVSEKVELTFDLTDVADEVQVGIMDFSGQLIRAEKFENVKDNTFIFNVKDLPAGPYFLSIYTPEGFRSKKFVVTK